MRLSLAVLLALGCVGAVQADKPFDGRKLISFSTQARVEVDGQGRVAGVTTDAALAPVFAQAVKATVEKMRFAPPMKDGRPVSGVTFVWLGACAVPEAASADYRFAVVYQGNGPARHGPYPRYPFEMMHAGQSAKMRLNYHILANGSAEIDAIEMTEGRGQYRALLRKTLQDWIAASTFEPEQLDGLPVTTKMSMPVEFKAGPQQNYNSLASARKHAEKETQASAAASRSCMTAKQGSDLQEREMALDSPFHLQPQG